MLILSHFATDNNCHWAFIICYIIHYNLVKFIRNIIQNTIYHVISWQLFLLITIVYSDFRVRKLYGTKMSGDESYIWSTLCTHLYFSSNIIITSSRNIIHRKHERKSLKRGKSLNIAFKYIFASCFSVIELSIMILYRCRLLCHFNSMFWKLSKINHDIKYVVCIIL